MSKYVTKQRIALIELLSGHFHELLSARQIAALMSDDTISISAVYRNMASLEKEGLVERMSKTGSREVFFRYTGASECKKHLHLSCKRCGRIYHMNSGEEKRIIDGIASKEGFTVDISHTVLLGICKTCKNRI